MNIYFIPIFSITILIISFLIGNFIVSCFNTDNKESFYDTFIRLLVGTFAIIFVYSFYKTNGNTIHLVFLVLAGCFVFFNKNKLNKRFQNTFTKKTIFFEHSTPLFLLIGVTIVSNVFYILLYSNNPFNNILHFDEVFYSYLSSKISLTGIETTLNIDPNNYNIPKPYHYTELWLSDIFSKTFGLLQMESISIAVKSYFTSIYIVGLLALTRHFTTSKIMYVFAVVSIFIAPVILDYNKIIQGACNIHQTKFALAGCLYIWSLFLFVRRSKNWFYPLLILPIINIAFAPVVLPILCIISIFELIKNKTFYSIIPVFIVLLSIALFYILNTVGVENNRTIPLYILLKMYKLKFLLMSSYRHIINIAMFSIYFIPILLLILYLYFTDKKKLIQLFSSYFYVIIYLILAFTIGNSMEFLFFPFAGYDAGQINAINYVFILNIIVFLTFLIVHSYMKIFPKNINNLFNVFVLLITIYNIVIFGYTRKNLIIEPHNLRSVEYLNNVNQYLKHNEQEIYGVRLQSNEEISCLDKSCSRSELMNAYWFTPFSTSIDFLYVTSLNTTENTLININPDTIAINTPDDRYKLFNYYLIKKSIENAPFTLFANKYEREYGKTSLDSLRYLFIKENKISYVVISGKTDIPELFIPMIDTVFTDSKTNEKFLFVKD